MRKNMIEEIKIKDMRMLVTPYPAFVSKDATADEIAKMLIANPNLKSIYSKVIRFSNNILFTTQD